MQNAQAVCVMGGGPEEAGGGGGGGTVQVVQPTQPQAPSPWTQPGDQIRAPGGQVVIVQSASGAQQPMMQHAYSHQQPMWGQHPHVPVNNDHWYGPSHCHDHRTGRTSFRCFGIAQLVMESIDCVLAFIGGYICALSATQTPPAASCFLRRLSP